MSNRSRRKKENRKAPLYYQCDLRRNPRSETLSLRRPIDFPPLERMRLSNQWTLDVRALQIAKEFCAGRIAGLAQSAIICANVLMSFQCETGRPVGAGALVVQRLPC